MELNSFLGNCCNALEDVATREAYIAHWASPAYCACVVNGETSLYASIDEKGNTCIEADAGHRPNLQAPIEKHLCENSIVIEILRGYLNAYLKETDIETQRAEMACARRKWARERAIS